MKKRTTASVLKQIGLEIEKVPEAALFSHVSPDGDCLGSMLALGLALESLGKKVSYYNAGPIPGNLKFLPHADLISSCLPDKLPKMLIFIDCAEVERVNGLPVKKQLAGKTVINIDHHVSNDFFGTINWIDPTAAATGEMVYTLIRKLGIMITEKIAINLYTAIITDTGRFSFSNTTAKSFRVAAELVRTGIDLVAINNILFEQKSLAQTRLLQKALANLELYRGGEIAVILLSQKDFNETEAEENLSEGLVNYARNIEGVEAAALLKEVGRQEIKVSFRSNTWLDVNKVASQFGGGGHIRASGCTIDLPLSEAKTAVISALEEGLRRGRDH
jgi:phosphoesterase RecJ-like protein